MIGFVGHLFNNREPPEHKKTFVGKFLPADEHFVPEGFYIGNRKVTQSQCHNLTYMGCVREQGTLNHYYRE